MTKQRKQFTLVYMSLSKEYVGDGIAQGSMTYPVTIPSLGSPGMMHWDPTIAYDMENETGPNLSRNFCATIFDMSWTYDKCCQRSKIKYIIHNREKCGRTGTPHFQVYFIADAKGGISRKAGMAILGVSCWISPRKGTHEQARHYCMKPVPDCICNHCDKARQQGQGADLWLEPAGVAPPSAQGKRTDLVKLGKYIREGATELEIAEHFPGEHIKYAKNIRAQIELFNPVIAPKVHIVLKPWQKLLIRLMSGGRNHRQLYYVRSTDSDVGKTIFLAYLIGQLGVDSVMQGIWKWEDLIHKYVAQKIVMFNLVRDEEFSIHYKNILEKASDGGIVTSGKYEGAVKSFFPIIIVVGHLPIELMNMKLPKRVTAWDLDLEEDKQFINFHAQAVNPYVRPEGWKGNEEDSFEIKGPPKRAPLLPEHLRRGAALVQQQSEIYQFNLALDSKYNKPRDWEQLGASAHIRSESKEEKRGPVPVTFDLPPTPLSMALARSSHIREEEKRGPSQAPPLSGSYASTPVLTQELPMPARLPAFRLPGLP